MMSPITTFCYRVSDIQSCALLVKNYICYYFIFPILIENKSSDFKENKQTKAS